MPVYRPYEAIAALAGAGKTYLLTVRYIGLLALGVQPERILAITFTRKAAGEIFDRIVRRLSDAELDKRERKGLLSDLREFLGRPDYEFEEGNGPAEWLRGIIAAMPRLRIGTIDSLFVGIAQAFALELGLPLRFEIAQGPDLETARNEALRETLAAAAANAGVREAFLESFRKANVGESKNVMGTILNAVEAAHELYLDFDEEAAWGRADRVWPGGAWWSEPGSISHDEACGRLARFIERHAAKHGEQYAKSWAKVEEAFRKKDWQSCFEPKVFQSAMENRDACAAGRGGIVFGRGGKTHPLSGPDCEDVLAILASVAAGIFGEALDSTRGRFELMRAYERFYEATARAQGRLSFRDVLFVLNRAQRSGARLDIDYRLDGKFDHWMIDEFQDTATAQWEVLSNLADEILQSGGKDRSFFYVGDVKQAIYGWRGGDSSLFDHVKTVYGRVFPRELVLDTSWRSSPAVLDAVNKVFGDLSPVEALPRAVRERWERKWQKHVPAPKNGKLPGRVELHALDAGEDESESAVRLAATADIVRGLLDKGVKSVAVLVRLNRFGDAVADALRGAGFDVRREVNPRLCDNGVVAALLALLRFADHPGDELAWKHLRMTPLFEVARDLARAGGSETGRGALADWARREVSRNGTAAFLGEAADRCLKKKVFPPGDFIRLRLRQLLDAALDFDRTGRGGPADLAAVAADLEVSDPGASAPVVVMTVHKAKGLEFDAVVLPDLQGAGRQFDYLPARTLCAGGSETEPWVFPLPGKDTARLDPVMETFRSRAVERRMYEELCLLYVAMTRARQGLYLVTSRMKNHITLYAATLLQQTLAPAAADSGKDVGPEPVAYAAGDPEWPGKSGKAGKDTEAGRATEQAPFDPDPGLRAHPLRRAQYSTPSAEEVEEESRPAESLFRQDAALPAMDRGSAIHDLFQRVEWMEDADAEKLAGEWAAERADLSAGMRAEARSRFVEALKSREIRAALSRPSAGAELWREQGFEFLHDETWVSGRFDRVAIEREATGKATGAAVLDFKSDAVGAEGIAERVEKYRPQMELYSRAVARLLGLAESQVRASLLFTHPGRAVDVLPRRDKTK